MDIIGNAVTSPKLREWEVRMGRREGGREREWVGGREGQMEGEREGEREGGMEGGREGEREGWREGWREEGWEGDE